MEDLSFNDLRQKMLHERETYDKQIFDKIKDNPRPDILDLWKLSEDRFIEWRRRHDFPLLLNHFGKYLPLFNEWKDEFKLTNEIIIKSGKITPFIEHKKLSKNKKLYLISLHFDDIEHHYVGYKYNKGIDITNEKKYEFNTLLVFESYLDWLKSKNKTATILDISGRQGYETSLERVYINTDFELLKMGGLDAPVTGYNILFRGKYLEFANLCGLRLSGKIYFGEYGNLSCSYCACDNLVAENLNMALLNFEHCSISNMKLMDSKIMQWKFYDSITSGDFFNSQLSKIKIYGGTFRPVIKDCALFNVEILEDDCIPNNNLYAYKTFKKIYSEQGDDRKANEYFVKENEYQRNSTKGIQYFIKSINKYYWDYGSKPQRIIYYSIGIIILFSLIYFCYSDRISSNLKYLNDLNYWDCLYFSVTTFTTLGYGDLSPLSGLRILTSIEAFFGMLNTGFLVAGFAKLKY